MIKPYLILIDGKLAEKRLTLRKAEKRALELQAKGYKKISIAYDISPK